MDRPNAISALTDKRREIAGRVDALQDQLREALINLDHVDCTILLFDPDAELDEIKAKPMPLRHHAFGPSDARHPRDAARVGHPNGRQGNYHPAHGRSRIERG